MKVPDNTPAKAKVTLAIVGFLSKRKLAFEAGGKRARKPMQPVENEIDLHQVQGKDEVVSPKKNGFL